MFRIFVSAFFLLAISGCSTVASGVSSGLSYATTAMNKVVDKLDKSQDENTARFLEKARGPISYRTAGLSKSPLTILELNAACRRGQAVELVMYAETASAPSLVPCARTYYTNHPVMQTSDSVLVVGSAVFFNGHPAVFNDRQHMQEFQYKAVLKSTGWRASR